MENETEDKKDEQTNEQENAADAASGNKPSGRFKPQRPLNPPAYPSVGPGNEPAAPLSVSDATKEGEDMVSMVFVKEVVLTLDNHSRVRFPIGMVNVPKRLADHWYLKAHGAKLASSVRPASPQSDGA